MPMLILPEINPLRVSYIEKHAQGLAGKRILDIGCGGGILCEALALKGALVTGLDMAEQSLQVARMHLHESKLEVDYQLSTVEDYSLQHENSYDIVTCLEMLEGGTGLGLTTARRLCEMLGGRLTANATPGQGAVFELVLPASS